MSPAHFALSLLLLFLCPSDASLAPHQQQQKPQTVTLKTTPDPQIQYHNPKLPPRPLSLSSSKKFEGSSDLVQLRYHMGPVLSNSPINLYVIWYGRWAAPQKLLIKDFLLSISHASTGGHRSPAAAKARPPVPLRGRVVAHRVPLHRPDGRQRVPQGLRSRRARGRRLLPRPLPHAALHPAGHRHCRAGRPVPRRPPQRRLPRPHRRGRHDAGLLPRRLRLPLLHLPLHGGLHPPLRLGRQLRPTVPRGLRLPLRHPRLHGRRRRRGAEAAFAAERGRRGGRHDQRDRARAGGAVVEPAGERVVRRGGPDRADGDRGPLRGALRDGRRFNMNGQRGRRFLVQWVWSPVLKACAGPNALD
ncbi:hypothetical protein EUGRSUZ_G01862 [Eucalyptus grandis]|uniref:Uncharacterized protein n=2 Tax=Eucalyptus grandis TaxID=71139 RepID=A0ACC3K6R1_EUCGR|nr:hypothetical protein EUGRSUZ_G01862 [Eucalyptus grandis]